MVRVGTGTEIAHEQNLRNHGERSSCRVVVSSLVAATIFYVECFLSLVRSVHMFYAQSSGVHCGNLETPPTIADAPVVPHKNCQVSNSRQ